MTAHEDLTTRFMDCVKEMIENGTKADIHRQILTGRLGNVPDMGAALLVSKGRVAQVLRRAAEKLDGPTPADHHFPALLAAAKASGADPASHLGKVLAVIESDMQSEAVRP